MQHLLPLHLKVAMTEKAADKNAEARADNVAMMNQFNPNGFRKPKTGKRMLQRGHDDLNLMSLAEKTSVDADMMEPYVPTTAEVRAARLKPRIDSKLRIRDPERYRQVREAERAYLKKPMAQRRAERAERRKAARDARKFKGGLNLATA